MPRHAAKKKKKKNIYAKTRSGGAGGFGNPFGTGLHVSNRHVQSGARSNIVIASALSMRHCRCDTPGAHARAQARGRGCNGPLDVGRRGKFGLGASDVSASDCHTAGAGTRTEAGAWFPPLASATGAQAWRWLRERLRAQQHWRRQAFVAAGRRRIARRKVGGRPGTRGEFGGMRGSAAWAEACGCVKAGGLVKV